MHIKENLDYMEAKPQIAKSTGHRFFCFLTCRVFRSILVGLSLTSIDCVCASIYSDTEQKMQMGSFGAKKILVCFIWPVQYIYDLNSILTCKNEEISH